MLKSLKINFIINFQKLCKKENAPTVIIQHDEQLKIKVFAINIVMCNKSFEY